MEKECRICKKMLNIENYYINSTNKDKLYSKCISCCMEKQREYRKTEAGKKKDKKYNLSEKHKISMAKIRKTDGYKASQLKYAKSEKGRKNAIKQVNKYLENPINKEKKAAYHYEYIKNRYDNDPKFRLTYRVRAAVKRVLTHFRINKNNKSFKYIGCSLEELKLHIEKQFQPGMTWENNTVDGWHIDHIIPLSSVDNEEDMYKLCHYTNLQPLWAKDNLRKGSKK